MTLTRAPQIIATMWPEGTRRGVLAEQMRRLQWLGLVLWRGGLLFAAAAALFEAARWILRMVDIPPQLEVAFGCIIAGMILVIASLILERVRDQRIEGDLRQ